jgi:hypothetical protein
MEEICNAKREPQIRSEINNLEKTVLSIREAVEALEEKLLCVMDNREKERPEEKSGPVPPASYKVPLAATLSGVGYSMVEINRALRNMADGIEL